MLMIVLIVLLLLGAMGALPVWSWSPRGLGYMPSVIIVVLLIVLLVWQYGGR